MSLMNPVQSVALYPLSDDTENVGQTVISAAPYLGDLGFKSRPDLLSPCSYLHSSAQPA